MIDIDAMAETGQSIIEPMQTKVSVIRWDDILIQGAQLSITPLNHEAPVDTEAKVLLMDLVLWFFKFRGASVAPCFEIVR